jgi:hypothetical protein
MQLTPRILQSMIQSTFGSEAHGNFEAVVVEGDKLNHWWRDNSSTEENNAWFPWKREKTIVASGVAWPGSIIQSEFNEGNLEVVVPVVKAGRVELWHFFRPNTDPAGEWQEAGRVTAAEDEVFGAPALIQSDLGEHNNFEVVVPIKKGDRVELWHYFRNHSLPGRPWVPGKRVTRDGDHVEWGASLIQSSLPGDGHHNLEVVVPLRAAGGRVELHHFFHDSSNIASEWQYGGLVAPDVTGPGVLIQSDFGEDHGNFEVVVPERNVLRHYWRDNSNNDLRWQPGKIVTESLNGWATIIQSDFGGGDDHKNFEVLAEEAGAALVSYVRPNQFDWLPWVRHIILLERRHGRHLKSHKIVQLTGDFDRSRKDEHGNFVPTVNLTGQRFGIHGTDLGSSFQHNNKTYFLFGDTWPAFHLGEPMGDCRGLFADRDAVAFTEDTQVDPVAGVRLTFLGHPPMMHPLVDNNEQLLRRQGAFNVPLEGISINNRMFVFFSTHHVFIQPAHHLMGRSTVTECMDPFGSPNEGVNFQILYHFSDNKFLNISLARGFLTDAQATQLNLIDPEVVFIWGSGRYRSSDVYLALKSARRFDSGDGTRYYCGRNGSFEWSNDENAATPLVNTGCVGELSVRWNPFLERYFMMFNGDSPKGVMLHSAEKPWGPWTHTPRTVFSADLPEGPQICIRQGFRRFIHASWKRLDHRDCTAHNDSFHIGQPNPPFDEEKWQNQDGDAYSPCQIGHMAKGVHGVSTELFFTMSTWNPYQVVLMRTEVTADDLLDEADLVRRMMAKSSALFLSGQHDASVDEARRAVDLVRSIDPIPTRRTEFLTLLGDALNNLTLRYKETGRLAEAGQSTPETTQAFLFAANAPGADRLYIAQQLIHLSTWLVAPPTPLLAEGIIAIQAAVQVLRGVTPPIGMEKAYADKFAVCMGTLVSRFVGASRRDEALRATPETIQVYLRTAHFPDADRLAISENLQSISTWLAHLAPPAPAEAVAPQQASVDVLRITPSADIPHRASLAQKLHSLAGRLRDAQRLTEALAAAMESFGLYDQLTAQDASFAPKRDDARQLVLALGGSVG